MNNTNTIGAIIFDWAGTMVDFGSRAPTKVFQAIFEQEGIPISAAQAREPMGMAKREHISAITQMPDVAKRWQEKHGKAVAEEDVDRMYKDFLPLQKTVLGDHVDLIPGAIDTFKWCLKHQIRVGSSTGYTQELMEIVKPIAKEAGYEPEVVLCAEDAPMGRPAPWLIFECAKQLGVYPMNRIVKVDDTVVGVQAGLNAGAWSVGVVRTGNMIGLSESELNELPVSEQADLLHAARQKMIKAGAQFVIEGVDEIPGLIIEINERMQKE